MTEKFTLEEHEKRIREILKPKPQANSGISINKLLKKAQEKRRNRRLI